MTPKEMRRLVDRLNEYMGRPISGLYFTPIGRYIAVLFNDAPLSGDPVDLPQDALVVRSVDEPPLDYGTRNVTVAYFF